MKKLIGGLTLAALLTSSAFADDLLAKITHGKLSDNSAGVKVLSLEEMKEVKGGIFYRLNQLDRRGLHFWVLSDAFYLTFNKYTGEIKSNSGTDSVRNKMSYNGNGVVVLGVKDKFNTPKFYLYDTNNKFFGPLVIDTFYKKPSLIYLKV